MFVSKNIGNLLKLAIERRRQNIKQTIMKVKKNSIHLESDLKPLITQELQTNKNTKTKM